MLLAKSPRGERRLTLEQHLLDTEEAACQLFRAGTRWATAYLRFFKLTASAHEAFLLHLRVAALFHDFGKANEGFQDAMVARGFLAQPLRHEHLSALALAHPATCRWLGSNSALDQDVIVAAVLSHHLKASRSGDWKVLASKSKAELCLFFDDPQLAAILARVAEVCGLPTPAPSLPNSYQEEDELWADAYDDLFDRADRFDHACRDAPGRRRLCVAVKAALIAADSVASATFRERLDIRTWIDEVAHRPALAPDAIERELLAPRIKEISPTGQFRFHAFQEGAARIGPRGLLLAGCGTGKTLAAWKWADAVCRERDIGRVIFLYPTRGTATEGFRDYVGHVPEGKAELLHGSARYELESIEANPDELPPSLRGKNLLPDETAARLFALGLWSKSYFSATVDQFLSFMENSYRGLCLLPALADSAIVLDEIHSYDVSMWRALNAFLEEFDVPVLCMTATLPPTRHREIEATNLRTYPSESERSHLRDLAAAEEHPRYQLEPVDDEAAAMDIALESLARGHRVLWVVNTVGRCQSLAYRLREKSGDEIGVYHSRFCLRDRQDRHRQTVDRFKWAAQGESAGVISVTTQVCEMSLDLDADVLISEHAPIASLVQRFGRANRHLRRGANFRARLVSYQPENERPYRREELEAASSFLGALGGAVSQRDLAEMLIEHAPAERFASSWTQFLTGGFFAIPGDLRDTDGYAVPVVLDSDLVEFKSLRAEKRPTDGLQLSVPRKHAREHAEANFPRWLKLASGARYCSRCGFFSDDELVHSTKEHPVK